MRHRIIEACWTIAERLTIYFFIIDCSLKLLNVRVQICCLLRLSILYTIVDDGHVDVKAHIYLVILYYGALHRTIDQASILLS